MSKKDTFLPDLENAQKTMVVLKDLNKLRNENIKKNKQDGKSEL